MALEPQSLGLPPIAIVAAGFSLRPETLRLTELRPETLRLTALRLTSELKLGGISKTERTAERTGACAG